MSEARVFDQPPQFIQKRRPPRSPDLIAAMKHRDQLERELLRAIRADGSELNDAPDHYVDMYKSGYTYADGISVPFPDCIQSLGRELCRADSGAKNWASVNGCGLGGSWTIGPA